MRLEFEPKTSTLLSTEKELPASGADFRGESDALREGIEAAKAGNRARARALFLRLTESEPRNEDAWLWLASVSEYPEELMIFLSNVLDVNPHNERALEWMRSTKSLLAKTFVERGVEAAQQNRTDFARQCFYQAAAHDSKNEMSWLWLASVADTTEEKQTHLSRVLAINPENADAQAALKIERDRTARILLRSASTQALANDRAAALATLAEILRQSPQFEEALILKAHLTENFAEKIECFETVIEFNPHNEAARAGLDSLKVLRNFADAATETPQHFAPENDFPPHAESNALNDSVVAEQTETAPEIKFEEITEETFDENFVSYAQPAEAEKASNETANDETAVNDNAENFGFFAENAHAETAPFAETVDFGRVSFDTSTENEQVATKEFDFSGVADDSNVADESHSSTDDAPAFELSDNVFEFVSPAAHISDFGEPALEHFESANVFVSPAPIAPDAFALTEFDEDVFAPNETAAENDFSLQAVDFAPPAAAFAYEKAAEDNNDVFAATEATFGEAEDAVRADEFGMETNEFDANEFNANEFDSAAVKSPENSFACPFCNAENDAQSYACRTCRAVLSLSDLEMLLANGNADRATVERAVERMEEERNYTDFGEHELISLGIGHINLKNLRRGLMFLQQASKTNPNNVVFGSQVNAFALRLEEIERREENSDAPAQCRTILVVDDSATVRKLISGKLEKSGHEVICAVDGMDALAKLEETTPDLILLDITMPRMDGYQVCKMIRGNALTRNIPVVMISGKDGFFDKVRGRMAGTTGYITKPFGPETLMKALEIYIKNTHEQIVAAEV